MQFTHVRNATHLIEYAGKKFLIDPMLAEKEAYPGFEGTPCSEIRIPTVPLPLPIERLLEVDAIIVTHTHPDHWDEVAVANIPKDKQIFVQNVQDAELLASQGFTHLSLLSAQSHFEGIQLIKTACQHGSDELYAHPQLAELMGYTCGVVFLHPDEKPLYLVGDTIWIKPIAETLMTYQPGVVVVNAGWAHVLGFGPIIMGKEDLIKFHAVLPEAQMIAVHMDALNHCLTSRTELKEYARVNQIADFVSAPEDGETLVF